MLTLRLLGRDLTRDSIVRLEPTAVVVIRASAPIVHFHAHRPVYGNGVAFKTRYHGTLTVYDGAGRCMSFYVCAQSDSYLVFHCDDDL